MPVVTTVGPLQQSNQPVTLYLLKDKFFIISSFRMWKWNKWKDNKTQRKERSIYSGSNLTQYGTAHIQPDDLCKHFFLLLPLADRVTLHFPISETDKPHHLSNCGKQIWQPITFLFCIYQLHLRSSISVFKCQHVKNNFQNSGKMQILIKGKNGVESLIIIYHAVSNWNL